MTTPTPRIGLIVPASNTATEVQFQRYAPPRVGVHTTRLRMTGKWFRPLSELADDIARAAEVLADTSPGVIVFHCTANSNGRGPGGRSVNSKVGRAGQRLSRVDDRPRRQGSPRPAAPPEARAHQPVREGHQRARDRVPG